MHSDNFQERPLEIIRELCLHQGPLRLLVGPFQKLQQRGDATGLERGRDM